jgi:tRNA-splicing ligase RtcB (3'-phosphate/5'-hydroxy nucleic acid ligase)
MPATAPDFELREVSEDIWEIPASARPDMRVPARVFADRELLDQIRGDRSRRQATAVTARRW